ncbi:MAG: DUF423 domain-containing protein [Bacteroidia bacterium]|nr:DUF423 domain-containing protein [Bacteroidia bacterium]MDW8347807.1 DUF423 domain-containing protein [Bacteroidia bacterium]
MNKIWLIIGAISGFLSVAMGAFGAHGLKNLLVKNALIAQLDKNYYIDIFNTGVKYQMFHTIAIVVVAYLTEQYAGKGYHWAGICFLAGILIFSGSLYVLCITGVRSIGAITPIGGICFLLGWIVIAYKTF